MIKRFIGFVAIAAACALFAAPAHADEAWTSPNGERITFDREIGDITVLTYHPDEGGGLGQIFIVGLGGQTTYGSHYQAYWVEDEDAGPTCPVALLDQEGHTWHRWGLASVTFARSEFPSPMTLVKGDCLAAPTNSVTLQPATG